MESYDLTAIKAEAERGAASCRDAVGASANRRDRRPTPGGVGEDHLVWVTSDPSARHTV